jgi:hypothetical protein
MTLTLELSPEVEQALNEVAEATGNTPVDYAAQILASHLEPAVVILQSTGRINRQVPAPTGEGKTEAARRAAIGALKGKYAHLKERGFTSAAIRAERERDKQREDRFIDAFERKTT